MSINSKKDDDKKKLTPEDVESIRAENQERGERVGRLLVEGLNSLGGTKDYPDFLK